MKRVTSPRLSVIAHHTRLYHTTPSMVREQWSLSDIKTFRHPSVVDIRSFIQASIVHRELQSVCWVFRSFGEALNLQTVMRCVRGANCQEISEWIVLNTSPNEYVYEHHQEQFGWVYNYLGLKALYGGYSAYAASSWWDRLGTVTFLAVGALPLIAALV